MFYTRFPNLALPVSTLLVSAMIAVKWLKANSGRNDQLLTLLTPEQLSYVKFGNNLVLFKAGYKILKLQKALESVWARQRLMPWLKKKSNELTRSEA